MSQRIGAGSTFAGTSVFVGQDHIKTFGVGGNIVGSMFLDVRFTDKQPWRAIAEGTFPAGAGSMRLVSLESAVGFARCRIRMSSAGSASLFYGGFSRPNR